MLANHPLLYFSCSASLVSHIKEVGQDIKILLPLVLDCGLLFLPVKPP